MKHRVPSHPSRSRPVPDSGSSRFKQPARLPSRAPDRAGPTRVESRPGPVLARHSSEGRFPRAFLDETKCPVPVPPLSFPLVRPLRRGRADLRVPSQCRSHRQQLTRRIPAGEGIFPPLERDPHPAGIFSGARRPLSPERTVTVNRREIASSFDKAARWHPCAGRCTQAPRRAQRNRHEKSRSVHPATGGQFAQDQFSTFPPHGRMRCQLDSERSEFRGAG